MPLPSSMALPNGSISTSASFISPPSSKELPSFPSTKIRPAADCLREELINMYWSGVKRELGHVVLTLQQWNQAEYSTAVLAEEKDVFIHGYNTFLNQVCDSSRDFAHRRNQKRINKRDKKKEAIKVMTEAGQDMFAQMRMERINEAIRANLNARPRLDVTRRRARLLLQAAQLLDLDKIIEYRKPEKAISFWKRPAVPQMTITRFDEKHMPIFAPQQCSSCLEVIRGSMFQESCPGGALICESCYRKTFYGKKDLTKVYKHCCLDAGITSEVSCRICVCISVPHTDTLGRPLALFPIDKEDSDSHHFKANAAPSEQKCELYHITDRLAEAKYAATRSKIEHHKTLEDKRREHEKVTQRLVKSAGKKPLHLKATSLVDPAKQTANRGESYGATQTAYEDIPLMWRSVANSYPFGNVHMVLRVGPLIIENSASRVEKDALITFRDPTSLQRSWDSGDDICESRYLSDSTERMLHWQQRPRVPRRYKAVMKQIVGGAFCGLFDEALEMNLIDAVIAETNSLDSGLPVLAKKKQLSMCLDRLVEKAKRYLSQRIEVYIDSITNRLLDPKMKLSWNSRSNNCQTFCDNLIDRSLFGSLFAQESSTLVDEKNTPLPAPLYLMSFVCRPGAYVKAKVRSKFDVPNGLTEEFLLKFHYGRHDDSDILDTLTEYWHDWAAFNKTIYDHQPLFPWDCTEAYNRYPGKCGECNLAKHVWAFPFDSWSMVSLHLTRPRWLYPQSDDKPIQNIPLAADAKRQAVDGHMSDSAWFKNRLKVLLAQDALLTAATAMSQCGTFQQATAWLGHQKHVAADRLKLGGIHRAQPFSHHFENGAFHQHFVAGWSHLTMPLRIKAYERLRDGRARLKDVGSKEKDNRMDDAHSTEAAFTCGGMAGQCAGGCSAGCGGGCGSGGGGGSGGCGGGGGGCGGDGGGCGGGCGG